MASMMTKVLALLSVVGLVGSASPQISHRAPVERAGFTRVTSYDSLQSFMAEVGSSPLIRVEPLTKSRGGKAVIVAKVSTSKAFGQDPSKLRVLLFAQQHGDEHSGKEALSILLARFASGDGKEILKKLDILIVPQMNPDGSELFQRRTIDSIDLNRNHLLLTSPETKTLHDLFYRWMPHVTLDIHEYSTLSRSWSDSGFIRIADVQLGMLTNANTPRAIRDLQHEGFFRSMSEAMAAKGYHFQEYIVGSPRDRVRHSTTEINDGRQSLGILGTVSFIQEGIKWRTRDEQLERRVQSQLASLRALLDYCAQNADNIRQVVTKERKRLLALAGQSVAMRMDHFAGAGELRIPVRMVNSNRDTMWQVRPYHGEVRLQKSVVLPAAYVIGKKDSAIVELLLRHHITVDVAKKERSMAGTAYMVDSTRQSNIEEEDQPLVAVHAERILVKVGPGDFVVSTRQLQSVLLAIILEPESMWGLAKYPQFASLLGTGRYPVLRIP